MMARPLRVLAICTDYPPAVGGIATLSSQIVRHLRLLGHDVKVICGNPSGCDPITGHACATIAEHFAVGERLGARELRLARCLKGLIPRYDPDIIWSSSWFPGAAIVAHLRRERAGRVTCFSAYASEILPNTSNLRQRMKAVLGPIRRRTLADADQILPISNYTREAVLTLGAPADRVAIVPGGVAPEWFEAKRLSPAGSVRLLTVARLDEHKGHDVVVQALPHLVSRWPDLIYEVVGPGDPRRLQSLADRTGVAKHVIFRGMLTRDQVMDAMGRASVFVMPSREIPGRPDLIEAFGLSFLEAAAVGLPAVGGCSGGVADTIVDGVTGFLVDPMSPRAVGEALETLIANPDLAQRIGAAARARAAAEFTWPVIVQRLLAALEPCLDSVGRRREVAARRGAVPSISKEC